MHVESIETLYEGWGRLLRVTLRAPDGAVFGRELEDHGEGAVVLPYDVDRGMALLVTQPRAALIVAGAGPLLEAPAGRLDVEGEPADAAARREALEEAGVQLAELEPVGTFWSIPPVSTERLHLFLGRYSASDRIGEGGGIAEEQERINVVEMPLATLFAEERAGRIADLKTAYLIAVLRDRLERRG